MEMTFNLKLNMISMSLYLLTPSIRHHRGKSWDKGMFDYQSLSECCIFLIAFFLVYQTYIGAMNDKIKKQVILSDFRNLS